MRNLHTYIIAPETGTDHTHGCHVEQSGEGAFLTNKDL